MHWPKGKTLVRDDLYTLVLVVPAFVALGLTGCGRDGDGRSAPRPELSVAVDVGVSRVRREEGWTLVRVVAGNRGADFRGRLELRGIVEGGSLPGQQPSGEVVLDPVVYEREAEVAQGARRELRFLVRSASWSALQLRFADGDPVHEVIVPLEQATVERIRLLWIDERPPEASELARTFKTCFTATDGEIAGDRDTRFAAISPRDLPVDEQAFDAFHAVVIDGTDLLDAPEGALAALAGWVENGGSLVAFPGPSWTSGLEDAFAELVGVRVAVTTGEPPDWLARLDEPYLYLPLVPLEKTTLSADRMVFRSARGLGSVVTFAHAYTERLPPASADTVLHGTFREVVARAVSGAGHTPSFLDAIGMTAPSALQSVSRLRVPPLGAVALAIFAYFAFGLFVPAYLCKRRGRREWTFAAIVVASTLGTVGIYRFGLLSLGQDLELNVLDVVRTRAGSDIARLSRFATWLVPRVTTVDPQGAAMPPSFTDAVASPLVPAWNPWELQSRGILPVTRLDASETLPRLAPVALLPNTPRAFRFDLTVPAPDVLGAEIEVDRAGARRLVLDNRARSSLGVVVLDGDRILRVDLEPGERPFDLTGKSVSATALLSNDPQAYEEARQLLEDRWDHFPEAWRNAYPQQILLQVTTAFLRESLASAATGFAVGYSPWGGYGNAPDASLPHPTDELLAAMPVRLLFLAPATALPIDAGDDAGIINALTLFTVEVPLPDGE